MYRVDRVLGGRNSCLNLWAAGSHPRFDHLDRYIFGLPAFLLVVRGAFVYFSLASVVCPRTE